MTSPLDQRAIAPHLREPIFRAYEPLLTTAVSLWPTESSFTVPKDIASATFLANFRNAIVSLKRYDWQPTTVDRVKLLSIETPRAFVIHYGDDGKLWFRSPQPRTPRNLGTVTSSMSRTAQSSTPTLSQSSLVPWGDHTSAELTALCLLINNGRLTGPYYLSGSTDPVHTQFLHDSYNVAIVYDKERNLTIIT